jgi:hypothetical protein
MTSLSEEQIRAQAIILLKEKYSYGVISKKLGRSKSWISKWANRYKQNSNETLQSRYKGGRKSVMTAAAQKLIRQSKYVRGQSIRKLERRLKDKRLGGCKETIRQYMRKTLKWKSFKRQKVPKLTAAYKVRRVNFAKKFKDIDWSRVMFTDESPFKLYYVPNSKNDVVWGSQESSVPCAPQVKFSPSVLVWGGITALGLTKLHIIPNKTSVNSTYYINEILEKEVKPAFQRTVVDSDLTATKLFHKNSEGLFQQDGARAHTSRASIEWLNTNINGYISPEDWPPNSPDLSPIENVWSIMATTVYADPEPHTLNILKRRLRKAWKSIPLQTLKNLIGSMPDRLETVLNNKGDTINY